MANRGGPTRPGAYGINDANSQIDAVLKEVTAHFRELAGKDANTLEAGMALMDKSSIGKARYMDVFNSLQVELSEVLKGLVETNYKGFNESIGGYHEVQRCFSSTQENVMAIKETTIATRSQIEKDRPLLKELYVEYLALQETIDILDLVESLDSVSENLEGQISRKDFLGAFETLNKAFQTIESENLLAIPLVSDLHQYLKNQQTSLLNTVLEELHNHLYLKSPYCSSRWQPYITNSGEATDDEEISFKLAFEDEATNNADLMKALNKLPSYRANSIELRDDDNDDELDAGNTKTSISMGGTSVSRLGGFNVEEDSLDYIRQLVETIVKLDKVPAMIDCINERLPAEIHRLVDNTIVEVSQRYPKSLASLGPSGQGLLDYEFLSHDIRLVALKDLLWSIYSKLSAVLKGHRLVFEVLKDKLLRHRQHNTEHYEPSTIFEVIKSELTNLLLSYISEGSYVEIQNKKLSKGLFSFDRVDVKSPELADEQDKLKAAFQASMPGLSTFSKNDETSSKYSSFLIRDNSSSYQLIVKPSVFNIRVLLGPTSIFLKRVKSIFPGSEIPHFVDNFMLKAFLPQLEDSIRASFERLINAEDSMEVHPQWRSYSNRPVCTGAVEFCLLVKRSCMLLNTGYEYRESYVNLIIQSIAWFVKRFEANFKNLTAGHSSKEILEEENVRKQSASSILAAIMSGSATEELSRNDAILYLALRATPAGSKVTEGDLLRQKSFELIARLSTSVKWLCFQFGAMREVSDSAGSSEGIAQGDKLRKKWSLQEMSHVTQSEQSIATRKASKILLFNNTLNAYDKTVTALDKLADDALFTLYADIRLRTVHYIDRAMIEGQYYLDAMIEESDPLIKTLESQLSTLSEIIFTNLSDRARIFVWTGLHQLINGLFIYDSANLTSINSNGLRKMYCNILALQQLMKRVASNPKDVNFKRSIQFFDELKDFQLNAFLENLEVQVKKNTATWSYDEAKIIVSLIHSENAQRNKSFPQKQRNGAIKEERVRSLTTTAIPDRLHNIYWKS